MKRIRRDPFRFDAFRLLCEHAQGTANGVRSQEAAKSFADAVRDSTLRAASSDTFIYGQRAEALFEVVVASLGKVLLLKQEDSGELYFSSVRDLQPPDYRIILPDGTHLLVEVKNFNQRTASEEHRQSCSYINTLREYASLMRAQLFVATYWVRMNVWTLVPETEYRTEGSERVLSLPEALMKSRMSLLGDKLVGTKSPMHIVAVADGGGRALAAQEGTGAPPSGVPLKVKSVTLLSQDRPITNAHERSVASFLLMYGDWDERAVSTRVEGDDLVVDIEVGPNPDDRSEADQGFTGIGFLSSMVSRYYREATTDSGGAPSQVRMDFSPGYVGDLVADSYQGESLPLWHLSVSPGT